MDILANLNPAQKEAVQLIEGPLLIVAGPGSGKTRVIAHRVAYLVKVVGVGPRRIMAVTFTNKAAAEMKERLEGLLGQTAGGLSLGTFHAMAARILRQEGSMIGLDNHFVIYDDEDQLTVIKRCLEEMDLDPKRYAPRAIKSAIERAKSQLLTPKQYALETASYFDEVVARVYQRYDDKLQQNQALDFDDLLMKVVLLFRGYSDVLSRYQSRYLHLLVDEFQDTNPAQYEIAKLLAGQYRNLCVVGDPDQSIYSWRHADLRNILSFEADFPEAKVIYLEQNYRSTQAILEAASHIIALNQQRKPKRLWTENERGLPITLVESYSEEEEAQFVAKKVGQLSGQGVPLKECAVMYRTNAQSRAVEEVLLRYGIPYRLVGALRFYQRREVKDILAYLRLIHNPQDGVSLGRIINVPPRGIGAKTLAGLSLWADGQGMGLYQALSLIEGKRLPLAPKMAGVLTGFYHLIEELRARGQELTVAELLDEALERSGYREYVQAQPDGEERWDNILELRNVASVYAQPGEEGLTAFLEGVSLVSDVDNLDEKAEAVTLITLHQAKGLEFGAVFILGVEEGVLPHYRSFNDPGQMEEERRLCYVGVTRARKYLYLSRALRRSSGGMSGANPPSRFIQDIPSRLVVSRSFWEEKAPAPEPNLLRIGDQVRHAVFGDGVVVSTASLRSDQEVTVVFREAGIKRLMLSSAPLERL